MSRRATVVYPKASTNPDATGVPPTPRFPEIEERVLAYWAEDRTFEASVAAREAGEQGANEFVFYDGPPFANGLPHYGHLLTGYVKDIVPRYQTMRGRRVERRFGWDTHGLPAELEAMRQLGMKTKQDIVDLGIGEFNETCRRSVLTYTKDWEDYVTRQARWVDFDNDYKTMNATFMESVIWAFKQLHDKGLAYEGFRILPYCWNDQTPLSNHELRMDDDIYQNRQDPAVTVGYRLDTGEHALIWTTTPWTLPSNMGVAVHPDVDYVVVDGDKDGDGNRYLLAQARLAAYARELGDDAAERIVARYKGSELVGRRYTPPFSYYQGYAGAHQISAADFVTTEDGTGLVHMSPGFGEDDKAVLDVLGVETVVPVGPDGRFTLPVTDFEGMHVFDANSFVIDHLRARTRLDAGHAGAEPSGVGSSTPGTLLVRRESYDHSYPHCWRCREPLIYMAVSSWFVAVTQFKDRMLELNAQIEWTPEHIKDGQFGKWLANARDWSVSRNRFWGSPIPVWKSDDPAFPRIDVYGSFAELERDFGRVPRNALGEPDLHRPFVDELTRPNPDDPRPEGQRSTMRRVEDVLDVWFDSGSMPFAQVHYPFESAEWFEHHYPGDFIVEYIGQTRGWFYTLHVLATALFDRPAFRACVSHGIVLGSDGQKMSKSLRNYPAVSEVFDRDGADAMRWFLMSSPILRGGNLVVTEQGIRDGVRQVMIPLWNAWYFFALYAEAARGGAGYAAGTVDTRSASAEPSSVLDRYLMAKLREFVQTMQAQLDAYEIAAACDTTRGFLDVLTNWYIRRSRDRFWDSDNSMAPTTTAAFDTLYTALEVLTRTVAPLLPLMSEEIWRGLTGGRSVHLTDWPDVEALPADHDLVAAMDRAREVCSAASALRKADGLRARLPLAALTVVTPDSSALHSFSSIIADEVNVRTVVICDLDDAHHGDFGVQKRLSVNARAAGPRLGKDVQVAIKAAKAGDWTNLDDGTVTAGGIALHDGEYAVEMVVADSADGASRAVGLLPGGGFVVLDTEVTSELAIEGVANDLVRAVQQTRREAGLDISDRISLSLAGAELMQRAAHEHRERLMAETLAEHLSVATHIEDLELVVGTVETTVGDGLPVRVKVTKR
ncbi:MAG: isoleucine--tRNA ligase [Candidatus Phosphoribacter sp.]